MWTKQHLYSGLVFFFNGIMGRLLVSLTVRFKIVTRSSLEAGGEISSRTRTLSCRADDKSRHSDYDYSQIW